MGFILKIDSEIAILEVSVFFFVLFLARTTTRSKECIFIFFLWSVLLSLARIAVKVFLFCFVLFCGVCCQDWGSDRDCDVIRLPARAIP